MEQSSQPDPICSVCGMPIMPREDIDYDLSPAGEPINLRHTEEWHREVEMGEQTSFEEELS